MKKMGWGLFIVLFAHVGNGQAYTEYEYLDSSNYKSKSVFTKPDITKRDVDLSCFISADAAYLKQKSGSLMVDVRSPSLFNQFKVAGSVNLAVHVLPSRTFLKNKEVLLLGDGFHVHEVVRACQNMKQAGFSSVMAIWGGTVAWAQAGLPIEGHVIQHARLASIPVDYFFQTQGASFWRLINLSYHQQGELSMFFPDVHALEKNKSVDEVMRQLSWDGKQDKKAILLIDEDGTSYTKYMQFIQKQPYPVFVLAGGLHGYREYLKNQQALQAYLLHPPVRKNTCGY